MPGNEALQQQERPSLLRRRLHQPGQDGRHLHHRKGRFPFLAQPDAQVQALVGQHRKGPAALHRQRRQHREPHVFEIIVRKPLLLGGQVVPLEQGDPVLPQQGQQRAGQAAVLLLHKGVDLLRQQPQLPVGRQPGGIRLLVPGAHLLLDAGHPHHEKFVQIGGRDSQEFASLQRRILLFVGLLQHPRVEVQPAELSVDIRDARSLFLGFHMRIPAPSRHAVTAADSCASVPAGCRTRPQRTRPPPGTPTSPAADRPGPRRLPPAYPPPGAPSGRLSAPSG